MLLILHWTVDSPIEVEEMFEELHSPAFSKMLAQSPVGHDIRGGSIADLFDAFFQIHRRLYATAVPQD